MRILISLECTVHVLCLMMFAGYNYLFKRFFLHLFFASKYIKRHLIPKVLEISVRFFKIHAFEWIAYIKSLTCREVCLMFIPFIHIHPEQEYIMNVLKHECFKRHFVPLW